MVLVIIEKISSHNENFSPHDGVGKIQVFPLFTVEAISFLIHVLQQKMEAGPVNFLWVNRGASWEYSP